MNENRSFTNDGAKQRANNGECKERVYLQPEFFFFFTTSFFVSPGGSAGKKGMSVTTRETDSVGVDSTGQAN